MKQSFPVSIRPKLRLVCRNFIAHKYRKINVGSAYRAAFDLDTMPQAIEELQRISTFWQSNSTFGRERRKRTIKTKKAA